MLFYLDFEKSGILDSENFRIIPAGVINKKCAQIRPSLNPLWTMSHGLWMTPNRCLILFLIIQSIHNFFNEIDFSPQNNLYQKNSCYLLNCLEGNFCPGGPSLSFCCFAGRVLELQMIPTF